MTVRKRKRGTTASNFGYFSFRLASGVTIPRARFRYNCAVGLSVRLFNLMTLTARLRIKTISAANSTLWSATPLQVADVNELPPSSMPPASSGSVYAFRHMA
jgi:hypothetical protein